MKLRGKIDSIPEDTTKNRILEVYNQSKVYVFENKLYIYKENTLPLNIEIYDLLGRNVMSYLQIRNSEIIDITKLNKGIYIMQSGIVDTPKEIKKIEIY